MSIARLGYDFWTKDTFCELLAVHEGGWAEGYMYSLDFAHAL